MAVTDYWFLTYTITAGIQSLIVLICGIWLAIRTVQATYGDSCHFLSFKTPKSKRLPVAMPVTDTQSIQGEVPTAIYAASLKPKSSIAPTITSSLTSRRLQGTMASHYS